LAKKVLLTYNISLEKVCNQKADKKNSTLMLLRQPLSFPTL